VDDVPGILVQESDHDGHPVPYRGAYQGGGPSLVRPRGLLFLSLLPPGPRRVATPRCVDEVGLLENAEDRGGVQASHILIDRPLGELPVAQFRVFAGIGKCRLLLLREYLVRRHRWDRLGGSSLAQAPSFSHR
jgi:hypothetical protein